MSDEPGGAIEIKAGSLSDVVGEDPQVQLRFVERPTSVYGDIRMVRILQQAWAITTYRRGAHGVRVHDQKMEWRDVPLVTE